MRRLFTLILALCCVYVASAQVENAIIIDKSTFKPVNSGVLEGVNIDPIGVDSSRRPCARIKMKVNRMTREEINGLELKIATNNECIKCKTAEYDNGLIIEMTAKPSSRFYLRHDKFGESNEVDLNLEANKEYYIEAALNQQFSVTVASNVADADIYIDEEFKGKTNSDFLLTVEGLLAGEHNLKLVYSGLQYEQTIVISSSKVFFRQDVDMKSTSMQYLIIKTQPSNALVEINGEVVENSADGASKVLKPGAFTYTVTAQNYHPKSGMGVMRGEQIVLDIALDPAFGHLDIKADAGLNGAQVYVNNSMRGTLPLEKHIVLKSGEHALRIIKAMYKPFEQKVTIADGKITAVTASMVPNFAQVTLRAEKGVEIWVDGTRKGEGSWSGKLEIGDHIVECLQPSHVTSSHTLSITSSAAVDRTFEPLKPIYGAVNITSEPIGATISIDGVEVGKTPLIKSDALAGKRTIKLSKSGYAAATEVVEVVEGKSINIKPTLSVAKSTTAVSTTPTSATKSSSKTTTVTKSKSSAKNLFLLGVGFTYGLGVKQSALSVPVDLRIGRHNQFVNLFVTGKYSLRSAMTGEETDVTESEDKIDLSISQWSVGGNLRLNLLKNLGKDRSTLFADFGAYYNFNTSATYKTSNIYMSTTSYEAGYRNLTTYTADILNKTSTTGMFAIGLGGSLMEVSAYLLYDFTPTIIADNLAYYPVSHAYNDTYPTTLADFQYLQKMAASKFNIGLSVKLYLHSGYFKK
jgi:hypothetical protein